MKTNKHIVTIERRRVTENLRRVLAFVREKGCRLAISTKGMQVDASLLRTMRKAGTFYDTDPENIRLILKGGKKTISRHHIKNNRHSIIVSNFGELSRLKKGIHTLYLFYDFGDGREGFLVKDTKALVSKIKKLRPKQVVVASIIGCISRKMPTANYAAKFSRVSAALEKQGVIVDLFSVGGSNCLPFLNQFIGKQIEVRVGYAIFFGNYDKLSVRILPLHTKNVCIKARIVKKLGRNRFLTDFGYSILPKGEIESGDVRIYAQSTDYSIVRTSRSVTGNSISIPISYEGLAMMSQKESVRILLS